MKLDNKNIIVTGANRGIGAAVVRALLKHNVGRVYAAARNTQSLPDFGDARVVPLKLDVTDQAQVDAAAAQAGDAHVLINNAGTAQFGQAMEASVETIKADMNTNYYGTLAVMRAFVPVLEKNGHGVIANVSSIVGLVGFAVAGGYSASKAALHSLTQSARAELAPRHIDVVGIYPGPIDTDMAKDIDMDKASPDFAAENIVAGLIAGDNYIFPDPMSQEVGGLWQRDPRALESLFTGPAEAQPEAQAV